ncbi:hypothetical protein BOTBODRAFT_399100 [Botryobasidium botryosum FD-172 SS1]|uniref:BTB domain-containing protein n=1 Tax=Botryobasidium botryosum (strain FD-172 SS1) TaxID=930990 RepID=A0A067MMZ5_BOTB1|nr:hypothetical protein BOTBODRAFT_399100 [Botryobasidium botryosum FD-172 SS1]
MKFDLSETAPDGPTVRNPWESAGGAAAGNVTQPPKASSASGVEPKSAQGNQLAPGAPTTPPPNTKDAPDSSLPTISRRHPKFWFEDGNIVVRVDDRIFRVHMSTLKLRSTFFEDIFSEEVRSSAGIIDGCNIIDLEGRSCDFSALLDWLYPGGLSRATEHSKASFFTLACLLRASHQWKFPDAKDWALEELKLRWPPKLEEVPWQPDLTDHATKVIVLLQACGERTLLKRAFYRLLCVDDFGIKSGTENAAEENMTPATLAVKEYNHEPAKWAASDSTLSQDDILRIIRLHKYTTQRWISLTSKTPSYAFLSDRKRHAWRLSCLTILRSMWHAYVTEAQFASQGHFDPLGCLKEIKNVEWEKLGICQACAVDCRDRWEEERRRIWDELDVELGITSPSVGSYRGLDDRPRQPYQLTFNQAAAVYSGGK